MQNLTYLLYVLAVIVFTIIYMKLGNELFKYFEVKKDAVSYDSAKEALSRMANWTTWLTGIQTASIAVMGLIEAPNSKSEILGFFVILFFGASIVLSTWLLSALPSIQQRLVNSNDAVEQNDIYMMSIFSFVSFRLGRFSGFIHLYFLVGIVFYALFIFNSFNDSTSGNQGWY